VSPCARISTISRFKPGPALADDGSMVRLVLGLATGALLLVGAYYSMKPPGVADTGQAPAAAGPATAGQVVREMKSIETANRATIERTLNAAK
jgi:hypothetical protein